MEHLVVMLPVLNEALGLAWVLERIPYAKLEAMGCIAGPIATLPEVCED